MLHAAARRILGNHQLWFNLFIIVCFFFSFFFSFLDAFCFVCVCVCVSWNGNLYLFFIKFNYILSAEEKEKKSFSLAFFICYLFVFYSTTTNDVVENNDESFLLFQTYASLHHIFNWMYISIDLPMHMSNHSLSVWWESIQFKMSILMIAANLTAAFFRFARLYSDVGWKAEYYLDRWYSTISIVQSHGPWVIFIHYSDACDHFKLICSNNAM